MAVPAISAVSAGGVTAITAKLIGKKNPPAKISESQNPKKKEHLK